MLAVIIRFIRLPLAYCSLSSSSISPTYRTSMVNIASMKQLLYASSTKTNMSMAIGDGGGYVDMHMMFSMLQRYKTQMRCAELQIFYTCTV